MMVATSTPPEKERTTGRCCNLFPLSDKSRIVGWLTNGIFLTPGSLDLTRPPSRFCNTRTLLCLFGIVITAVNLIFIATQTNGPQKEDPNRKVIREGCPPEQFPRGPPPPPGEMDNFNMTHGPPSVIVDIAIGSSRFLAFFVNLMVRFGAILAFPKVRQILHCLQNQDATDLLGNKRWSRSWNFWTVYEKVYLTIIAVSFGTRVMLTSGIHFLRMLSPCTRRSWSVELLELVQEQSMVIFSLESALEVATFLLLSFMGTFTHSQELECSEKGQANKIKDNNVQVVGSGVTVHLEELFLNHPYTRKVRQGLAQSSEMMKKPTNTADDGENDRQELERLLHAYFDMTAVWEHASSCTGSLTLLIFVDHTLSFCVNVFMALASLSRFGLGGHFFVAVVTASIIISKLICVAYMAQMLPDATAKLADRVLELSWKKKQCMQIKNTRRHDYFDDDSDEDENLSQILEYVRKHPLTLSALGYFTVSKPTLTSISGVVVTYLVVLVQFHIQTMQQQEQQMSSSQKSG